MVKNYDSSIEIVRSLEAQYLREKYLDDEDDEDDDYDADSFRAYDDVVRPNE